MPFADGEENVGDLEDVVEVSFDARAVFENFVFVTGYFEALFAFFETYEGDVCQTDLVGGLKCSVTYKCRRWAFTYLIDLHSDSRICAKV